MPNDSKGPARSTSPAPKTSGRGKPPAPRMVANPMASGTATYATNPQYVGGQFNGPLIGYQNNPAMAAHYGTSAAYTGVYGTQRYTTGMLDGLYGAPRNQIYSVQGGLYSLGYLTKFVPGVYDQHTRDALERAMADANRNGMSLEQMLNSQRSSGSQFGGGGSGGGGGGGGGTTVQRSISLTSREGAMSVLQGALANELGRQPTPKELTDFTKALNAKEQANPTVTTTTVSGKNVSQTTKQGNVDPNVTATDFAKQTPRAAERNKFQDSQYLDVISQMLGVK